MSTRREALQNGAGRAVGLHRSIGREPCPGVSAWIVGGALVGAVLTLACAAGPVSGRSDAVRSASPPVASLPVAAAAADDVLDASTRSWPEWNIQYRLPDERWQFEQPDGIFRGALVRVAHRDRPFSLSITAFRAHGTQATAAAFFDAVEEHFRSVGAELREIGRGSRQVAGVAGETAELLAQVGEESWRFVLWSGSDGEIVYRIAAWMGGRLPRSDELLEASLAGFRLHESASVASVSIRSHHSPFGYAIELPDDGWVAIPELASLSPHAEWGVVRGEDSLLAVLPFALLGTQPAQRQVEDALLGLLGVTRPNAVRTVVRGALRGISFDYDGGAAERPIHYRVLALSGPQRAVLVLAAGEATTETDQKLAIADSVRFDPLGENALPSLASLTPERRHSHALFFNAIGVDSLGRGEGGRAVEFFEKAREADPDDRTILRNLVEAQIHGGRYAEALAALELAAPLLAGDAQLLAYRAMARGRAGEIEASLADFDKAFAAGVDDPTFFEIWIDLLVAAGRSDQALERLDAGIARTRSLALRRKRAQVLRHTGDTAAAAAELQELQSLLPGDVNLRIERIGVLGDQGDFEGALAATREAIGVVGRTPELELAEARFLAGLGRREEAQSALRAATASNDPSLQSSIAYVSALLGQGPSGLAPAPIDPVPVPRFLASVPAHRPTDEEIRAAGAWYRHWWQGVSFRKGQELRQTTRLEVVVAERRAVETFSSFEIPFHSVGEDVFVNRLEVRDESGALVAEADPADAFVVDDPEQAAASFWKRVRIPVPGVRPGVTIELVYTKREKSPPAQLPLIEQIFSASQPIAQAALFLTGDIDEITWRASPELGLRREPGVITWSATARPAHRPEPLEQRPESFLPRVLVAQGGVDWQILAREYLGELRDLLVVDGEIGRLARLSIRDAESADDRARALAAWVQQRLTYEAIEFGRRARIPPPAGESLHRAFGDCKDHALVLVQMMRSAGLDAHLALVSLTKDIEPSVPSLDQFDHMIAYCASCEDQRFFDATDKNLALGLDAPLGLADTAVLILDPEAPSLETIPPYRDPLHRIAEDSVFRVLATGDVEIEETLRLEGAYAASVRPTLRSYGESRAIEVVRSLVAERGTQEILAAEIRGLERLGEPLEIVISSRVPQQFAAAGHLLVGRLPRSWLERFIAVQPLESRSTPFSIEAPVVVSVRIRVVGPEGFAVVAEDGPQERSAQGRLVAWTGARRASSAELSVALDLERAAGKFDAPAYAILADEISRAIAFLREPVIFSAAPVPLQAKTESPSIAGDRRGEHARLRAIDPAPTVETSERGASPVLMKSASGQPRDAWKRIRLRAGDPPR